MSSELKLKAKEQLQGKKVNAALMLLVYFVIEFALNMLFSRIFPDTRVINNGFEITKQSPVASILNVIITVFFGLGLTNYYMKLARGEDVSISDIFSKGNLLLKAFVTAILSGLVICGGTLLLVIPGIILTIAYSMITYIYIDNPEIGIIEVMKKSREMMKGHKWEFFCLCFSFIGWFILCIFTLGLLCFWLLPYLGVTQANFYDSIK